MSTDRQTQNAPPASDMTVLYNGACSICGPEVDFYQRCAVHDGVDITFENVADATSMLNDQTQYFKRFHVRSGGVEYSGVAAFILLWQRLHKFKWLARLVSLPLILPMAHIVYDHILAPLLYWRFKRRQAQSHLPQASQERGHAGNPHKSADQ